MSKESLYSLVKSGYNVNQKNPDGDTLLHLAVKSRDEAFVDFLLVSGADRYIKDSQGFSAEDYARQLGIPLRTFSWTLPEEFLKGKPRDHKGRPILNAEDLKELDCPFPPEIHTCEGCGTETVYITEKILCRRCYVNNASNPS